MNTLIWLPEHPTQSDAAPRTLARHGKRWMSGPPSTAREARIAVIPAAVYQWHVIDLPRLPRKQRHSAAASLVEPLLLTELESTAFFVQPPRADGKCAVAVLDQEWISAAQQWLDTRGIAANRWIPEDALLPASDSSWVLLQRDDEWILALGPQHHLVLDRSPDDTAPALFRGALQTAGAPPRECLVAGLPHPSQLAEHHTPTAPLWLATQGVRARIVEGTDWLQTPATMTPDLSPAGSRGIRLPAPDLAAWRVPLTLALLALGVHGAGLSIQYLQWRDESAELAAQIRNTEAGIARESVALQEPAAHRALAQQLERLIDLGLSPPALTRVQYDNGTLIAELDAKRININQLAPRASAAGGVLSTGASGAPVLRLAPLTEAAVK